MFNDVTVILGDPRLPDRAKVDHRFGPEDFEAVERMKAALSELSGYRFRYLDNHATLLADLLADRPAFVLNFCDTGFRNVASDELLLPAMLETLEIPYSGADPACMVTCYDKSLVRAIAARHGVPVPEESYVDLRDSVLSLSAPYPLLLKPCRGDGSVGITQEAVVHDFDALRARLDWFRRELPGQDILAQEFLTGAEYSVALIGNPGVARPPSVEQGFEILPPLEVDYSDLDPGLPPILSYESKTIPESPYWKQLRYRPASLDEQTASQLVDYSARLFQRLECRDYARFDFRADAAGEIKLLEVNPNAAWCWDGKLNLMAGFAGMSYADLLRLLLETAQRRYKPALP